MNVFLSREPFNAWSHGVGFLLAILGTAVLWHRSRDARTGNRLSLMVFGLSLIFCYAASALFHGLRLTGERLDVFDRLDRIGIFFLIAGTYTPLAWTLMRGWWRWSILGTAWTVALTASIMLAIGGPFPPLLNTSLYLAMGWGAVACYAELARVVPPHALRLLVVGGVFYTVGAVLNVLHWPVLWPGVFGVHSLFHLFVIAGSVSHYWLMLRVVVPFRLESGADSIVPSGTTRPAARPASRRSASTLTRSASER